MAKPGWIKLYYSILENPMWEREKPFTEGQAWIDLLLLAANWTHNVDGEEWKPGEVHLSKAALMERWGWTRWKYDKVIKSWKEQKMIDQPIFQPKNQPGQKNPLTIVKWEFFQGSKKQNQPISQPIFQPQPKNIYKNSAECGAKSPRPRARKKPPVGGDVQLVKNEQGEWVAVKK